MNKTVIAIIVLALLGTALLVFKPLLPGTGEMVSPAPQACTQEAKVCADGSTVGRSGADCAFALCPEERTTPQIPVTTFPVTIPDTTASCFVGGCSGQICSDQPGMASTCEYREEYACYQSASCERQASGACGWTQTAALRSCLSASTTPTPVMK